MKWFLLAFVLHVVAFGFTVAITDKDLSVDLETTRLDCFNPGIKNKIAYVFARTNGFTFGKKFTISNPTGKFVLSCNRLKDSVDYKCWYNKFYRRLYAARKSDGYYVEIDILSFTPERDAGMWKLKGEGYERTCNKTNFVRTAAEIRKGTSGACVHVASMSAVFFWATIIWTPVSSYFKLV